MATEQACLASLYSHRDFGTPHSLLQRPQAAIRSIGVKLTDIESEVATYTQDCSAWDDLRCQLSKTYVAITQTRNIDVGYVNLTLVVLAFMLS